MSKPGLFASCTRYIFNLIPYLGKSGDQAESGQGERVVHQLTSGLAHKGHTVCCDNFFTSPGLFDALLRRGIFATGTVMHNRIGFPSALCGFKKGDHPKSTLFWQMHSSGLMAATTWFDSKPVSFLRTSADPVGPGIALRWSQGVREEVETTPQQVEYQTHMRGVDLIDQMRRDYTVQYHSRKWWHKLMFFVVDSSLMNAWVLFRSDMQARGQRIGSRLKFYFTVAKELVTSYMRLPRTCTRHNTNPDAVHMSERHEKLRRKCRVCGRKQNRYCAACGDIFLCDGPCYKKVHTLKKWALRVSRG